MALGLHRTAGGRPRRRVPARPRVPGGGDLVGGEALTLPHLRDEAHPKVDEQDEEHRPALVGGVRPATAMVAWSALSVETWRTWKNEESMSITVLFPVDLRCGLEKMVSGR